MEGNCFEWSFLITSYLLVQVASLDTAELLAGGWQDGCLLLVLPGGADLPYCKHLNGRGNTLIRGGCSCLVVVFSAAGAAGRSTPAVLQPPQRPRQRAHPRCVQLRCRELLLLL